MTWLQHLQQICLYASNMSLCRIHIFVLYTNIYQSMYVYMSITPYSFCQTNVSLESYKKYLDVNKTSIIWQTHFFKTPKQVLQVLSSWLQTNIYIFYEKQNWKKLNCFDRKCNFSQSIPSILLWSLCFITATTNQQLSFEQLYLASIQDLIITRARGACTLFTIFFFIMPFNRFKKIMYCAKY